MNRLIRNKIFTTPVVTSVVLLLLACSDNSFRNSATASSKSDDGVHQLAVGTPTPATEALFQSLHELKDDGVLFGHQDSLAYGVEWTGKPNMSDIKLLTGSYPALYGWDVGHLELSSELNLDGVPFEKMQEMIRLSFSRGAVNSISWHMTNPIHGGSSWDTRPTVRLLLPGEAQHYKLVEYLDAFADFVAELTFVDSHGEQHLIPLIFRPWHEHNGDWFWWSKAYTEEQDYTDLWRFTVEYLRDQKGLNNLIFAYSPDRSRIKLKDFESNYNWGYPGDAYVDVIGLDNYWDFRPSSDSAIRVDQKANLIDGLTKLSQLAESKGKIAALTEGGQENIPDTQFWTDQLLPALLANQYTRKIVYVQVWRNANREKEQRDHFFAPYPGQTSAADFQDFYKHPFTLFEDDLPDLYHR